MTKDKQQSPVEWLYLELFYFLNGQSKFEDAQKILERAKEMEKEQIKNAHNEGYGSGLIDDLKSPEQYYNETYGGSK